MNQIIINNIDATNDIDNVDSITIDIGYNENNTIIRGISNYIKVSGNTFDYFEKLYFEKCKNLQDIITTCQFVTDICGEIVIDCEITTEGLKYYPDAGSIEVLIKSLDPDDKAYELLNTTYLHENNYAISGNFPVIHFVEQPSMYGWLILLLVVNLRFTANILDDVVKAVCTLISLGGILFKCGDDFISKMFKPLDDWIMGTGQWASGILVRDAIEYHCRYVGLNFESTILKNLDSEFYNLTLLSIERGKSGKYKDKSKQKITEILLENAPLLTVIELLKNLTTMFDGYDFRIISGTLYFEPKSYFVGLTNKLIYDTNIQCNEKICYEYDLNEMFAYGEYSFQKDGIDTEGIKIQDYYEYKSEWNKPYSSAQKGVKQVLIPFSPSRFMFDQYVYNNRGFFDWEVSLDLFRKGGQWGAFETEGMKRDSDIVLSGKFTGSVRILVLEKNFDYQDAKCIKRKLNNDFYLYNYPLLFKETLDKVVNNELVPGDDGNMKQFCDNSDPRKRNDIMGIDSIVIDCNCEIIHDLIYDFSSCYVQTKFGKAIPKNATIKFTGNNVEIEIRSLKIYCND